VLDEPFVISRIYTILDLEYWSERNMTTTKHGKWVSKFIFFCAWFLKFTNQEFGNELASLYFIIIWSYYWLKKRSQLQETWSQYWKMPSMGLFYLDHCWGHWTRSLGYSFCEQVSWCIEGWHFERSWIWRAEKANIRMTLLYWLEVFCNFSYIKDLHARRA